MCIVVSHMLNNFSVSFSFNTFRKLFKIIKFMLGTIVVRQNENKEELV